MSSTGKVFTIIFSILLVVVLGFGITWICINADKVKEGMSGSALYTEEDLENAHQDGYNEALENEQEYLTLINEYRDTITNLTDTVSQLNLQIQTLTNTNNDYEKQIETLTNLKTQNEATISSLNETIEDNNLTIASNNETISSLTQQVEDLEDDNEDYLNKIETLNTQISYLETVNKKLEKTNASNLNTIATLNSQIQSLNSQISDLVLASQNSAIIINNLNAQIDKLEDSIVYYESVISGLTTEGKVAVTFEFNGSVHNVQIVPAGSTISVTTPTSTDYVIFNYWMVDGEQIDLSTYTFSESTKVIANVTYKYDVKFMVDATTHNSQIVTSGSYATLPAAPTKTGYDFDGWSLDGVTIIDNIATTPVTGNITYKAVFTKLHTVTFVAEGETKSTQSVRNGKYATDIDIEGTTYKVFNGWTLNGALVDISTQKIVADTTFIASFTYKYDVKFMNGQTEVDSQIVTSGSFATLPASPTKEGYTFKGWSLIEGGEIVNNIESLAVTQNVTYYAVFEINTYTVTFMSDGSIYGDVQTISHGSFATLPADPTKEGCVFSGWSLTDGGEVVSNIDSIAVTQSTIYYAVYKQWVEVSSESGYYPYMGSLYVPLFSSDDEVVNLENFSFRINISFTVKVLFESELSKFSSEVTFTNDNTEATIELSDAITLTLKLIAYERVSVSFVTSHMVGIDISTITEVLVDSAFRVNFIVDNDVYSVNPVTISSQLLINGESFVVPTTFGSYSLEPGQVIASGVRFLGWSLNNNTIIDDISSIAITADTTIYAVVERFADAD